MTDAQDFRVRYRVKGTGGDTGRPPVHAQVYLPGMFPFSTVSSPYEAASMRPRVSNWQPPSYGPNTALGGSLDIIRRRSREKHRNNGQAETIIDTIVTNAVGTGIVPQFRTKDAGFNKFLADLFYDWTEVSDPTGTCDWYGQQAQCLTSALVGAECFARVRSRRPEDGLPVPFQVQLLESEFCPVEKSISALSNNGSEVVQGVEFNGVGNRTAYYFYKRHPGDVGRGLTNSDWSIVPAAEVMHVRQPGRPDQVRGEPWLVRALIILQDYDKYNDAQLLRQQISQYFAGFVETDPLFAQTFFAGQQSDAIDPAKYFALAPLMPAQMQFLNPGQKMTWSAPPGVGSDYEPFTKHAEQRIAGAGKILYEQLTGDYSQVNDRTWRAAMLGFRRRIEMLQEHVMVFQFCNPTVQTFLNLGMADGSIVLPKGITERELRRVYYAADKWDYINPVQDIAAEVAEVRAGFSSRTKKVSERGEDRQRLDNEIAEEQQSERDKKLTFDTNGANPVSTPSQQANPPSPAPPGSKRNARPSGA